MLYRDPGVGKYYKHESPYTYFTSSELHLGEISLECSRAGASAVALWATQKLLPMERDGEFAIGLSKGREAALALYKNIDSDERFRTIFPPELDIVVWVPDGSSASQISERSEQIFNAAAQENLHLATFRYPTALLKGKWSGVDLDQPYVTCLRSCLIKPEHLDWVDRIWALLGKITNS